MRAVAVALGIGLAACVADVVVGNLMGDDDSGMVAAALVYFVGALWLQRRHAASWWYGGAVMNLPIWMFFLTVAPTGLFRDMLLDLEVCVVAAYLGSFVGSPLTHRPEMRQVVALIQLLGAVVGTVVSFRYISQVPGSLWFIPVGFMVVCSFVGLAGVLLLRGHPYGWSLSLLAQAVQIPALHLAIGGFLVVVGLGLHLRVDLYGHPSWHGFLGSEFGVFWAAKKDAPWVGLNAVAMLLTWLLVARREVFVSRLVGRGTLADSLWSAPDVTMDMAGVPAADEGTSPVTGWLLPLTWLLVFYVGGLVLLNGVVLAFGADAVESATRMSVTEPSGDPLWWALGQVPSVVFVFACVGALMHERALAWAAVVTAWVIVVMLLVQAALQLLQLRLSIPLLAAVLIVFAVQLTRLLRAKGRVGT